MAIQTSETSSLCFPIFTKQRLLSRLYEENFFQEEFFHRAVTSTSFLPFPNSSYWLLHHISYNSPTLYFASKLIEQVETQPHVWRVGQPCPSDAGRQTGLFLQKQYKPFAFLQAIIQEKWWQAQEKCFCVRKVNITCFPGSSLCLPPWHMPRLCHGLLKHDTSLKVFILLLVAHCSHFIDWCALMFPKDRKNQGLASIMQQ